MFSKKLNKGIKGQLLIPCNDKTVKSIESNRKVFKAICDTEFDYCEYDLYEATYQEEDVFGINFDIRGRTRKEVKSLYSIFKKEIKENFKYHPTEIFILEYDKV